LGFGLHSLRQNITMRQEELTRAIQGRREKAKAENPEKEAQKMVTAHAINEHSVCGRNVIDAITRNR
jgi:hypothetical protein